MLDVSFALRELSKYTESVPLQVRTKLAAEIIRQHRKLTPHPPDFEKIFGYLKVQPTDVASTYQELYRRPLFLNYVPLLREEEANKYTDSSETGLTDVMLYLLRSRDVLQLRRLNGSLFANREDWERYRNRSNGKASLAEAVGILDISRPYGRKLIRQGILPATKVQTGKTYHYEISIEDIEALKPKLEWANLSKVAKSYEISRERIRQILEEHTLSAHINKRRSGKKKEPHWKRIRKPHEVLVRLLDFEQHFSKQ